MGTNNEDRQDKGQFVQFPLHLIYERKDVSRDDKWVLLAIMGKCWSTGPHRLSYTDIAALADVPKSLLASFDDKKSGKHHEGIIDRLVRVTGYIRIVTGREINHTTGKLYKNAQSYIYIDYARIWQDNVQYCHAKKPKSDVFCVSEDDYQPVSNTNKVVSNTNNLDRDANEVVSIANDPVSNTNKVVSNLPLETTPYITEIDTDITDIPEESNSAHTDTDSFAPPHVGALSLSQSSDTDYHSQSLPLSSAVTTRNEEGDTHGTDNTHSSASHPHSREPGVDLTPARNGSQAGHLACTAEQRPPRDSRQEQEIASQEGDTHAQPLQPLPTANSSHRGSGDVPSRDSQVNGPGFTSPLDTPPVDCAQGSDAVGREGRAGVAEDTARGIGSGSPGEADTTGDTARGQVTAGDDHAHLPAGSARGDGALPGAGSDSHDAAVDDRHVAAPEAGPVLEAGQEEEVNDGRTNSNLADMALADTGHHLAGRPDYCHKETAVEQIAPREDVPVVAASLLTSSTVEPGESGEDTLPAAPVTEQEDVKPARSRQSKVKPIPEGPPVMPVEDAPWCAETIVQICEARRGRRYPNGAKRKSDRERDVQLEYAKQLAEMPDIDREKLLKAASHQETRHDNWWMETNGYISPKQLVEKDRIHDRLDELMRLERKKSLRLVSQNGSANGAEKPTNQPTTNIRELVRQREAARAAQVQ